LGGLLDFTVTPLDAGGASKPAAPIFLEALKRAGTRPDQTVHVGDEPFSDGKGAEAVGIHPVVIDRHDAWNDAGDYRRITSLAELPGLVAELSAGTD
jgi:FMN phosphatase YigB (HAD superfamily)